MKIYDITQELLTSVVYPGDKKPELTKVRSMDNGDGNNVTNLEMCAHNGTHVDAPKHFVKEGKSIDELDLNKCIGPAYVYSCTGDFGIDELKDFAKTGETRLLIKGNAQITPEAAAKLSEYGIVMLGVEDQSIAPKSDPTTVHRLVLGQEIFVLEGCRLGDVPDGRHFLFCAPIKIGGGDGAPCRAVLIDNE